MKKTMLKTFISFIGIMLLLSFTKIVDKTSYKCMIQMTQYSGEGAYVITSLLDAKGKYIETLHVNGDDKEWYHEIESWWRFYGRKRTNIDAITGATIGGGERNMFQIAIPKDKIGQGYKLRFEAAVEHEGYYEDDVELELSEENLSKRHTGKGFIKFIQFRKQ